MGFCADEKWFISKTIGDVDNLFLPYDREQAEWVIRVVQHIHENVEPCLRKIRYFDGLLLETASKLFSIFPRRKEVYVLPRKINSLEGIVQYETIKRRLLTANHYALTVIEPPDFSDDSIIMQEIADYLCSDCGSYSNRIYIFFNFDDYPLVVVISRITDRYLGLNVYWAYFDSEIPNCLTLWTDTEFIYSLRDTVPGKPIVVVALFGEKEKRIKIKEFGSSMKHVPIVTEKLSPESDANIIVVDANSWLPSRVNALGEYGSIFYGFGKETELDISRMYDFEHVYYHKRRQGKSRTIFWRKTEVGDLNG
jgi:hypothetical protein